MRHDICYRDNENRKAECDRKMLAELNALTPRGRREKVDRQPMRGIIGMKLTGNGCALEQSTCRGTSQTAEEALSTRRVFAKQVDDIWTADLVDMSPYSRSNSGYKYLLTVIDVFSKYGWIVPLKTKTGKEVAMAFPELFTDNALPSRLWTDRGTEFYNQQVKRVLTANIGCTIAQTSKIPGRIKLKP